MAFDVTELVEVNTQDLSGEALNWAVFCAIYKGIQPTINVIESTTKALFGGANPVTFPRAVSLTYLGAYGVECNWNPSGDWEVAGPLIEKNKIGFGPVRDGWVAHPHRPNAPTEWLNAERPLVAICRAIVADRLGMVVSVPKELMP